MNEAQYALIGVVLGGLGPAISSVWQSVQTGRQAEHQRTAEVDRRREEHRLTLLATWRDGLAAVLVSSSWDLGSGENNPLYTEPWYLSLLPHLSEDERRISEPPPRTLVVAGASPVLFGLAEAIARIEREWGLS